MLRADWCEICVSREWDAQDEQGADDPEPIMVDEDDADDLLAAVLEGEIGLGERDWDSDTRHRCVSILTQSIGNHGTFSMLSQSLS